MITTRLLLFLLLFGAFFPRKAGGQVVQAPIAFKTLNVADGLPQSFISGLVQDSTGFIWIATRDGLARYDGRKFKTFRHIPGDSASLANNTVTALYLDKKSRLWIAYETGDMDVLNTATEALFHLTKDSRYKSLYATLKPGHSIAEEASGGIWLLTNKGDVFVCNLDKRSLQFYSAVTLGLQNNKIISIAAAGSAMLAITDTALVYVGPDKKITDQIPYTFVRPRLFNPAIKWKDIQALHRNGEVVMLDEDRLIIFHPAAKTFTVLPLPTRKDLINFSMAQEAGGNIFFDCNGDIYALSPANDLSIWKPKDDKALYGFKSMLVDRSGVLWLGGNGSGLQLYDLRLSRLTALPYHKSFHEDVLQNHLFVPVAEIEKTFLFNMQPYNFRWVRGAGGRLWFSKAVRDAVKQPQLCYYEGGHLVQPPWYYTDTATGTHINISAMALSGGGKLWGIDFFLRPVSFDTLTKAVTVYPSIASAGGGFNFDVTHSVSSVVMDGEDAFWIGTALNGLFFYNRQTGRTIHYVYSDAPGALPTNQLMNLVQDASDPHSLWIGSLGGGLIKFNKLTGTCRSFTTADGLPNNTVYAVTMDAKGILWCSSNKGIFSFHPATGTVRSFTSKDGLPGDEFNRYHFLQLPNGHIAFGGVDGYTAFDPLAVAEDNYQPTVALTALRVNNNPDDFGNPGSPLKSAINSLTEIVLPYHQNFLSFEFAALEYNIPEKLQYRYILEGFDEKWIMAGNDNLATYTKLPPGHYTLRINATNTAGNWSRDVKTLSVVIQPPFWKTVPFITLCILAIAAVIYFFYQRRIAGVRAEEQQKATFERESAELKAQALRAQMNPHFIFNCLNSIKALIQEDNKRQAVVYLTTFSKLIRAQMNNAEREVSLYEELETCRLYARLEALRFGEKILCEFKTDGVDTRSIRVPPLIVQPFIENAIWHGVLPKGGGRVTVDVKDTGGYVHCSIDDDGIGRKLAMRNKSQTSSTYESKGMKLVKNRLSLFNIIHRHGGSIEVIDKQGESGQPAGTLVLLKFKKLP